MTSPAREALGHESSADSRRLPPGGPARCPWQDGAAGRVSSPGAFHLPSFFVIGPPRTGTSWIHEVLSRRALLPDPTKETRFFDIHFHHGIEWYRARYPYAIEGRLVGEVAPTYFASPQARERIAHMIPEARVVCIFRNPVQRVLSLYRLKRAWGMIPWSFEEAIVRDPELLTSSKYATHLKAWQRDLGKDQVLATVYDDLRNNPQSYMDRLVDFVGIPRFAITRSQTRYVHASEKMTQPRSYYLARFATCMADWCKAQGMDRVVAAAKDSFLRKLFLGGGPDFGEFPRETLVKLCELFRPEVEELESILNRDFSRWKFIEG